MKGTRLSRKIVVVVKRTKKAGRKKAAKKKATKRKNAGRVAALTGGFKILGRYGDFLIIGPEGGTNSTGPRVQHSRVTKYRRSKT